MPQSALEQAEFAVDASKATALIGWHGFYMNDWQLGPFTRRGGAILGAQPELEFSCPIRKSKVRWAAKDMFNPAAVVRDGKIFLLVRAEDQEGRHAGTSRIGLAESADGESFTVDSEPVIFPNNDEWHAWEWEGGCEDPRVVETPEGGYVCFYTAFDGKHGGMFVASSDDLITWRKHGPAFANTPHIKRWSKSGAVVTKLHDGRLVAARIGGKFWMYWGEGICFAATSDDLIHWQPLEFDGAPDRFLDFKSNTGLGWWNINHLEGQRSLRPLLFPRPGRFDSEMVEPGPPAVLTEHGIVLLYNGCNALENGDPALPGGAYFPGQVLFDANEPASPVARTITPFLAEAHVDEKAGQYQNVCFAEGLVFFRDEWRLYFGMADSKIGCAVAKGG